MKTKQLEEDYFVTACVKTLISVDYYLQYYLASPGMALERKLEI